MIEFLEHLFGLCGETHLNILPILWIIILAGITIKSKIRI